MKLKEHLEQLFKECEHGDEDHRKWLKGKFDDYISRNESEDEESTFVTKLIKELPAYGIDTSRWEYNHGDCCDDAVEFIARCINSIQNKKEV